MTPYKSLSLGASKCCVPTCPRTHRILHRFPKPDMKRFWKLMVFKIWLFRACNQVVEDEESIQEIVKYYRICDIHFTEFCKLPPSNKLRRGSLPTLFLPTFSGEPNELNSQFALLQYCPDSKEMKMFGEGYKPPPKWDEAKKLDLILEETKPEFEPPTVFTIPDLSQQDIELNLQNVIPKQKTVQQEHKLEANALAIQKPYFKSVKIYLTSDKCLSEVCRICFCAIQGQNMIKLYHDENKHEQNDESQKFRDMLKEILPDLDLEIYQNSVVCTKCKDLLVSSFELRTMWLTTETKLKKIIENEKGNPNKLNASLVLIAGTAKNKKNVISKPASPIELDFDHNYARKAILPEKIPVGEEKKKEEPINFNVEIFGRRNKEVEAKGPFLCELCGQIISDKRSLKKHLFRHEKRIQKLNEQQRQSMCESCGMIFDTLTELKKHSSRKHRKLTKKAVAQPVQYQCEICDKIFYNKHSLQKHIRHIHLKIYNYVQCHVCGKRLTSRSALRQHLLAHNASKRYSCDVCEKKFYWLPALKKHLLRHSDQKLECEFCGKTVKYERTLKQHIQIFHMNEGKTNCEFCGKPYWKKFDLMKHKIKIHGWTPEQQ